MTYYLTSNTRLTKRGESVTIHSQPHPNVWLVTNQHGEVHSVVPEVLSLEPVVDVVVRVELPIDLFNQI